MKKVLTIGEPMGLFIAEEEGKIEEVNLFSKQVAGAELNVAIGLARLGYSVSYATSLGQDPIGRYLKSYLKNENIDVSHVNFSNEYTTGLMIKEKAADGNDPCVASYRKFSAASQFDISMTDRIDLYEYDLLHATGIFLALSDITKESLTKLKEKAKKSGTVISFDPNLRVSLWKDRQVMIDTINEFAKNCDFVLPGVEEGKILTGSSEPSEIADFYINLGVKCVVVKLGPRGGYFKTESGKEAIIDGFEVKKVVDTVGAGDGFAVGIISGILDNCQIEETVKRATAIGAIQVMSKGDNDGLPTVEELKDFMEGNRE